jgi:type IV secretion system protein VirD4
MKKTLTLTISFVALFLTLASAGMARETVTQQPTPDTRTAKEREQDDAAERWRVQERERLRREKGARVAGTPSSTSTPSPGLIDRDELERQVEEDQRRLQEQINRTGRQPQQTSPGIIQTPPVYVPQQQPTYNNGVESSPTITDNYTESQTLEAERRQREWNAEEARAIEHEKKLLPYVLAVLGVLFLAMIVGALKYPKSGIRTGAIITISGAAVFILLTYLRGNYFAPRSDTALDIVFMFGWLGALLATGIGLAKVTANLCTIPKNKLVRFLLVSVVSIGFIVAASWLVGEARRGSALYLISMITLLTGIFALIGGLIKAAGGSSATGSDPESEYHGSARLATDQEIKELTIKAGSEREPGSFILAPAMPERGIKGQVVLPRMQTTQHGLILGGTGTGKSRGYFLPNCAQAVDTSLVVTDPKSELWKLTSGFQPQAVRYAPADPEASEGFNWIPLCNDARMAELCARAIMQSGNTSQTDQFFIDTESAFLAALFAHASTMKEATPLTAYRLFTRQTPDDLIKQLLESPSETAREQAVIFMQTDPRYKGAIVPAVAARLQFMRDKAMQRFTSATLDAPDFGRLRREPTAIYWCLREQDIVRLRPLTSLFFTVLLEQLAGEQAAEGEEGVPVSLFLDEFANIGTIPDFETTISLARGRGVALWLGVQSLSQLDKAYGRENAQTIITNCLTKIALHALDYTTAKYVSDMLGEKTVVAKRHGFSFSPTGLVSMSRHGTEHRKMLMTPDEVMRLSETEAIIRTGNKYPMRVAKGYYDEPARTAPAPKLGEAITKDFPPLVMAGSTSGNEALDIL